jgi:hypothetical protein
MNAGIKERGYLRFSLPDGCYRTGGVDNIVRHFVKNEDLFFIQYRVLMAPVTLCQKIPHPEYFRISPILAPFSCSGRFSGSNSTKTNMNILEIPQFFILSATRGRSGAENGR